MRAREWQQRASQPALLLALALVGLASTSSAAGKRAPQPMHVRWAVGRPNDFCPLSYPRHTLADIASRAKRPYLFGGIFSDDLGRPCPNCQRGGLWGSYCGFRASGDARLAYWENQLCNASTIDAAIDAALAFDAGADMLTMTPCDLWYYLRGRTTWVVGDSMSKDLFKAIKCFLVEFMDLRSRHASNNFTAMHLLGSLPGLGEPYCVHMPQNTRVCQVHAIEGDLFVNSSRVPVGVLPLLQESLAMHQDIFVVNFGLWHGESKQAEYGELLHQLGRFYQATKDAFPNLFFMETPKQHFDSADGDYLTPWIGVRRGPWTCQPVPGVAIARNGSLLAREGDAVAAYVAAGSWRNILARAILGDTYGVPLVPVYNVTATAWRFHRRNHDGQECSHFCHPSVPQLWLYTLAATFKSWWISPVHNWDELPSKPGCAQVWERDEANYGAPLPNAVVAAQHHAKRSLWDLLLGRNRLVEQAGVLLPYTRPPGPSHHKTLTAWKGLEQLLLRQRQAQLEGGAGERAAGSATAGAAAAGTTTVGNATAGAAAAGNATAGNATAADATAGDAAAYATGAAASGEQGGGVEREAEQPLPDAATNSTSGAAQPAGNSSAPGQQQSDAQGGVAPVAVTLERTAAHGQPGGDTQQPLQEQQRRRHHHHHRPGLQPASGTGTSLAGRR